MGGSRRAHRSAQYSGAGSNTTTSASARALLGALLALALAAGLAVVLDLGGAAATPSAEAATVYGRVTNGAGRCLENLNNGTAVNNRIQINACGSAPAQQWSRQPDTTLRTPGNRCIEPYQSSARDNTVVVLVACSGSTSQQWTATGGTLVNKRTGKCLQYLVANMNGMWAGTVTCNRSVAQRWTVPAVSTPAPVPTTTTPKPTTTTPKPTTTVPPTTTTTPKPTTTTPKPTTTVVPTTTTTVPPTTTTTTVPPTTTTTTDASTTTTTTTTTPTAAPTPPPFVAQGTTVWAADLTKPDVVQAGFVDRGANRQLADGVWGNPALAWPIPTVAAPGDRGGRSVGITLPKDAIRYEVEPNHRVFVEGDDYYFGFAFMLGADFPLDTTSWQVIEQLHGAPGTGSPPVSFQATGGRLVMEGGANKPGATSAGQYFYNKKLVPLERGRWYNVVYHVTFSADPTKSFLDVWVDGQKVVSDFQPPCATVYPPTSTGDRAGTYRKEGLYHDKSIPGGTIHMAGQKLGTGYAAADPSR